MKTTKIAFYKSLNGRLLAALVLVTIISVGGVGLAAYLNEQAALEAQVIAQLTSVADLKRNEIIVWLAERQADARLLAVNKLNQDHLTQILSPDISEEHKEELADFLTNNLIGLQRSRPGYSEIEFVNTQGEVIISTDPDTVGHQTVHEVAFSATLAGPHESFIQDIHINPNNGLTDMTFGHVMHAIDLESGAEIPKPIGTVIIVVNVGETIYPLIENWPSRAQTGETILTRIEEDGTLFLNNLRFYENAALNLHLPKTQGSPMPAQLAAQGSNGIIQTLDYRGVPVLAAYRHIPNINWGFVAKQDINEAFAPVNELASRIVFVMSAVLLVAGGVSIIMSRTLTRPLDQLVVGTQAVAAGDLTIEIGVDREDEVGQLTHAFNAMTHAVQRRETALQELTTSLEQRVEERTADLKTANKQLEQEIVERKRAEKELVRLASFPELSPSPIIEIDLTQQIHYLNPMAHQLFPDLSSVGIHHPLLTGLSEILEGWRGEEKQPITDEMKVGSIWFQRVFHFVATNQRVRIYAFDVSERKRVEEALRDSEERFRQVISSVSDHIYMTKFTKDGQQVNGYISPNVVELTGYTREQILTDWSFWPKTLIHPDDRDVAATQVACFAQGQNSEVEYRLIPSRRSNYLGFEITAGLR